MGLFGKRREQSGPETRLFFCTDLHASEMCLRKLFAAEEVYGAKTLIMGGDCTGKQLVPLELDDAGDLVVRWAGEEHRFSDEEEAAELERRIRNVGSYPVRLPSEEVRRLERDPEALQALFSERMLATVAEWVALSEERLASHDVHFVMTPGNDDEFNVDEVIRASKFVDAAEGRITRIGEHEMLSVGWSNETPWDTPRECSEEELAAKIEALAEQVEDMESAIFNIHVPPYGTGLDEAPELDEEQRPSTAISAAVGSTAVRDAILHHQPLLSLHGHIHESRGAQKLGRTLCINPGSVYGEGVLQGVIVDLVPGDVKRYSLTSG
jgi:Icc-related predicted phosphoesterase